jgi:hypothetical protein
MIFGEERIFQTNAQLKYKYELFLRFMGKDSIGLKMHGIFPNLWKVKNNKFIGPQLVDVDGIYNILGVDYNKGYIWLNQT